MKTTLYDINAKAIGEINLNAKIFGVEVRPEVIALAVRAYLSNKRSAFALSKTRSEIRGTTKKMWAQKGTGRARHSNAKAPQFVGGGVSHGPRGDQNYTLKITKKQKIAARNAILSKFAANNSIIVVEKLSTLEPKTKQGLKLLTGLRASNEVLSNSRKIGLVTTKTVPSIKRAFGNIEHTDILSLKSLSVYDLANHNFLIFTKKAVESLSKRK